MVSNWSSKRLYVVLVGLGLGAAVASPDGTAEADSSVNWWSDPAAAAVPAALAPASPLELQISFDGKDLLPTDGNLATATSVEGQYGLAIAYGDGAHANAAGGIGNFALADGSNAFANAGTNDSATYGASHNIAVDIGSNTPLGEGGQYGAVAGEGLAPGTDLGSNNVAIEIGDNTPSGNGFVGAMAGGLNSYDTTNDSDGNVAVFLGGAGGTNDGAYAGDGSGNFALQHGITDGPYAGAFAEHGNNNTAIADTLYNNDTNGPEHGEYLNTFAGGGDNNFAEADGVYNGIAQAGGNYLTGTITGTGSNDTAYVFDPSGTHATSALAGSDGAGTSGSHDLATVLLTDGHAVAQGDYLYDIISALGNESGHFPTSLATLVSDWAALF